MLDRPQTGCRCLELDLWDGEDGEPLITHGRTDCTTVGLQEVARAIAEEAFIASDYPLILCANRSIESAHA